MAIDISNWAQLILMAPSYRLRIYEPGGRLDFFVHIPPTDLVTTQMLRDTYHLHVFLESDVAATPVGQQVMIRIATILPKTANAPHVRPNLATVPLNNWTLTVGNMMPNHPATTDAATRFADLVRSFQTNHAAHGAYQAMA